MEHASQGESGLWALHRPWRLHGQCSGRTHGSYFRFSQVHMSGRLLGCKLRVAPCYITPVSYTHLTLPTICSV
eukprot:11555693-Alexandrium_andersonii.AAC.1